MDVEFFEGEEEGVERVESTATVEATEEKHTGKRQFNDTLLTQLLCPTPPSLPRGTGRRVYGVMSDTPVSRRTRLYQSA